MLTTATLEQYAKECEEKDMNLAKEVAEDVLSRRFRMERYTASRNEKPSITYHSV